MPRESSARKIVLKSIDDIFSTEEEREDAKLVRIRDIPISMIDDFPDHPFKVKDDEDMQNLIESVRTRGIITPATIRLKEDGRYEMISGHRRKRACELLGMETLRCEIVEMSKDEATILMVESNYQRSTILPSEKAFAYKMRLEAMKRMPGRPVKNNSDPVGPNFGLRSNQQVAEEVGDSKTQVQRYIRLTNLVPELLDIVDEGRIKMRPAVELSYLDENAQMDVLEAIEMYDCTPSHSQAIRIRQFREKDKLTPGVVEAVMSEEKPNQKEKFVLHGDRVRSLIPPSIPREKTEEYVLKALEHYGRYLKSREDRDER